MNGLKSEQILLPFKKCENVRDQTFEQSFLKEQKILDQRNSFFLIIVTE
jgi:hypothetical protein|tara:strand:+ start:351 stop:497 length:147 start_codon:yes stop_codon:yes gene_type:complete